MDSNNELSSVKNISRRYSLGIRGRLWIGFMTIIAIVLIMVGVTLSIISVTKTLTDQALKNDLPSYEAAFNLATYIHHANSKIHKWVLTGNDQYKKDAMNWDVNVVPYQKTLETLSSKWTNNTAINNLQQIKLLLNQLRDVQDKILSSSHVDAAKKLADVAKLDDLTEKTIVLLVGDDSDKNQIIDGITDIQHNQLTVGSEKIISNMNNIQIIEYFLSIFCIVMSFVIAYFTTRSILRHINVFRQHSSRIASGDLRQHIELETNDEIGLLGKDLNTMTDSLSGVTRLITQACHNMVSTLEEVRQAVDMQSSGATEQASSINQITVSLDEIEKSSSQTMEKARELGMVAERTREKGQLGLEAVQQSIQGMKSVREKVQLIAQTILELSNQTQQVGEITGVVNTLAQQSKMLALNASIEAAKAGEAGKGFSVVAAEVKNLAEQSEQSTTQVQKILEDIRRATEKAVMVTEEGAKGVDHGTGLVEQTGEVVKSLSDVIHEATIASQQIEAAVRQEGAGIEQITAGMNEINQVTSSFVNSVKQTTEAISNLATIAKDLKEQVDTYKI